MASQFNLLLIHSCSYPKLRSSTDHHPTPYTIKTTRQPDLPLIPQTTTGHKSSSFQTRKKISLSPIACKEGRRGDLAVDVVPTSSSWVETWIPEQARPYAYLMRLHKLSVGPIISMPCLWSIAFTTQPGSINIPDAKMLALFMLVGIVNRGILCTINDILDRDVDAKVKRTTSRPLASGALTLFQGLSCLGLQMLLCYGLLLPVNALSRNLWVASLVLGFTYPLMKRLTYWVYLGFVVNSLNLCGWSAVKGSLDPRILIPLCIAGIFWVMSCETIYSHQDKEDDVKIGVKTPALLLGDSTKKWVSGFAVACIGAFALTGSLASIGWPFYVSLVAASIHLGWQISSVDLDSPADCFKKFDSNLQFGAIILCGILLGRLYQ